MTVSLSWAEDHIGRFAIDSGIEGTILPRNGVQGDEDRWGRGESLQGRASRRLQQAGLSGCLAAQIRDLRAIRPRGHAAT